MAKSQKRRSGASRPKTAPTQPAATRPQAGVQRRLPPGGDGTEFGATRGASGPILVPLEHSDLFLALAPQGSDLASLGTKELDTTDFAFPTGVAHDLQGLVGTTLSAVNVGAQLTSAAYSVQGLYRLGAETQRQLANGAVFMTRDGVRLGSLVGQGGGIVAPVELLPAFGAQLAGLAAALGPALVLLSIQVQLGRLTRLVQGLYPMVQEMLTTAHIDNLSKIEAADATLGKYVNAALAAGQVLDETMQPALESEQPLHHGLTTCLRELSHWDSAWNALPDTSARQRWVAEHGGYVIATIVGGFQALEGLGRLERLRAWHLLMPPGNLAPSSLQDIPPARLRTAESHWQQYQVLDSDVRAELAGFADQFYRRFGLLAVVALRGKAQPGVRNCVSHLELLVNELSRTGLPVGEVPTAPVRPAIVSGKIDEKDLLAARRALRWVLAPGEWAQALFFCAPFAGEPNFPSDGTVVVTGSRVIAHTQKRLAEGRPPIWELGLDTIDDEVPVVSKPSGGTWIWLHKDDHYKQIGIECRRDSHEEGERIAEAIEHAKAALLRARVTAAARVPCQSTVQVSPTSTRKPLTG